jgi:hypothetical protein
MIANAIMGTIQAIQDHGSVVIVCLKTDERRVVPVYFDYRPFGWLLDGEGCSAEDLVGRTASYDGTSLSLD